MRTKICVVMLAAAAWGCNKKTEDARATPVETSSGGSSAAGGSSAPGGSGGSAAPPSGAAETVTHTGVLDLDLVEHGGKYTVRDGAYEISFPAKPEVSGDDQVAPTGAKFHTATVMMTQGDNVAGFIILPIPSTVPYDVKAGLDGARDQSIANVKGTLVSEVPTKVGGLDGRKVTATADAEGRHVDFVQYLAFDDKHHCMVDILIITFTPGAFGNDVVSSFTVKPGAAPPAGDGK